MNIAFTTARAWLDEDGYHVWQAHDCRRGRSVSKLPWPTWQAVAGRVEPSVLCEACGLHAFMELSDPPPNEVSPLEHGGEA